MAGVPRTRSRSKVAWQEYGEYGQASVPTSTYTGKIVEWQNTIDETRHGWRTTPPPEWDAGGLFDSTSYKSTPLPYYADIQLGKSLNDRWFKGFLLPNQLVADATLSTHRASSSFWYDTHRFNDPSTNGELDAMGTTAISRCAPTNPHASVYTMIGELRRDGLPALTGLEAFRKRGKPKAYPATAGSEYLNVEFGIKPLLSDLRKLLRAAEESKQILRQYQRDAGRHVRREYELPYVSDSETVKSTGFVITPSLDLNYWDSTGSENFRTTTVEIRRWFSGAFMYRLPDLTGPMGAIARVAAEMNHLFGITPTPQALWNLTPWTWAADWFTNMGDVVNNASMYLSDGLVLKYGYVMEQITLTNLVTTAGPYLRGSGIVGCGRESVVIRRRRRRATPFGFGLNEAAFTPRQWAIIAALGLSQGGRYVAK